MCMSRTATNPPNPRFLPFEGATGLGNKQASVALGNRLIDDFFKAIISRPCARAYRIYLAFHACEVPYSAPRWTFLSAAPPLRSPNSLSGLFLRENERCF